MTRLLNIAFAVSAILFLSACGDDESTTEPTLLGDWNVVSLDLEVESTFDVFSVPLTTGAVVE
ncbi:MAG: hypothetical protein WBA74_18285, partial [Cyclobacteriaceae bacterium]